MTVAPSANTLFDDFLVIGLKSAATSPVPTLLYCFRTAQGEGGAEVDANNVALMEFCFPDVDDEQMLKLHSESFAFTLTHGDGTRTFGFSRRLAQPPGLPICLCVLSQRPWFSLFMHMLDILQLNYSLTKFVPAFIGAAHSASLPAPGGSIVVNPGALEARSGCTCRRRSGRPASPSSRCSPRSASPTCCVCSPR